MFRNNNATSATPLLEDENSTSLQKSSSPSTGLKWRLFAWAFDIADEEESNTKGYDPKWYRTQTIGPYYNELQKAAKQQVTTPLTPYRKSGA